MPSLRELVDKVSTAGVLDIHELEALSELIYADGVVDREEAESLIGLRRHLIMVPPGFKALYLESIKRHLLADGQIDSEEVEWLRRVLFFHGEMDELDRELIRELNMSGIRSCPEFAALVAECVRP